MPRVPLHFPSGGRLDSLADSSTPHLYTSAARNVRVRDPVTGKLRGASRAGFSNWNESAIGTGRIKALCSAAIDDRKLEYSYTAGAETTLWDEPTPSKTDCAAGRTDSQGNVYALDGPAGIVKFNPNGTEIMKIALPIGDPSHVVRALWIDEADRIFAGVSEGGDVRSARVWCILQLEDNEYQVLWTLEPGAYTEELRVYRGSQLYAAHNYPLENRARVLVYESLGLEPTEAARIESVAYPINSMALGPDGSVYTASQAQSEPGSVLNFRAGHPSAREFTPVLTGWTPYDDSTIKVWSDYDARTIDEDDVEQTTDVSELIDNQQILRWRDISGNERHFYAGSLFIAAEKGPGYAKNGIGGRPSLRFVNRPIDGTNFTKQSLCTEGNASIDKALADQQRTAIPAHVDGMWAMFILLRPATDADATTPSPRIVFAQKNQAAAPATSHILFVNRDCSATVPGSYSSGLASYYAVTDNTGDAGQCAGPTPQMLGFDAAADDEDTGAMLLTILWDGGVDPNDTSKTRCLFRVNGRPVDRCEGLAFTSLEPSWLGLAPGASFSVAQQVTSDGENVVRRFNGEIAKIFVVQRRDRYDNTTEPKLLTHDQLETGDPGANQTDNQLARIEAWIAYDFGVGHILTKNGETYPHFYGLDADDIGGPPAPGAGGLSTAHAAILHNEGLTAKHDAQGKLQWVVNTRTHPDTGLNRGGIGYGVAVRKVESDGKTHVWMSGPDAASIIPGGDVAVRKVIDQGATFSGASADGAWRHKFTGNATLDYAYPRLEADKAGNLYLPGNDSGGDIDALHIFQKDPDGSGLAQELTSFALAGDSNRAHAVAIPPDELQPDYRGDLTTEVVEHVYLFTEARASTFEAVHKIRLVTAAALATGSPRSVHTLALVEDDVRLVTATTNVIPSGGSAAFDPTAQYVQCFRAGDDIVILDGTRYLAYSLRDGTVSTLVATSAGEIPPRAKLGMFWRHRLMLGAFADASGNYAASKLGDIRDWNLRPGTLPTGELLQTSTQAFTGTITRAGEAEDALLAMIPVVDDLAFLICESRILRLTGDPQDGGNIHKVTDSMGGVFGDSWCKDARGRVFMFGNAPPGLYQLPAVGDPEPLSAHSLEESEFSAIDFSTHRITLAWDPIRKGVHIFQVAWATSTVVDHWFWEERTHHLVRNPPLWTDRIYSAEKQPTAVAYLGEDDTRTLLIGCADGFIRKVDPAALTDDGDPIDSFALMKVTPSDVGPDLEYRMREIRIALADDQGGARCEVFASETADTIGPIRWARDLKPGLNVFRCRVKGAHLWVRIRNAAVQRWAYESGSVEVYATNKSTTRQA